MSNWVVVSRVQLQKSGMLSPVMCCVLSPGWVALCIALTACQTSGRGKPCLWSEIWWVSVLITLYSLTLPVSHLARPSIVQFSYSTYWRYFSFLYLLTIYSLFVCFIFLFFFSDFLLHFTSLPRCLLAHCTTTQVLYCYSVARQTSGLRGLHWLTLMCSRRCHITDLFYNPHPAILPMPAPLISDTTAKNINPIEKTATHVGRPPCLIFDLIIFYIRQNHRRLRVY